MGVTKDIVTGAGKGTVSEVIQLSQDLMKQRLRRGVKPKGVKTRPVDHNRKWDGGHVNHNPNKRPDVGKNFYGNQGSGSNYAGDLKSGAVGIGMVQRAMLGLPRIVESVRSIIMVFAKLPAQDA